MWAKIRHPAPAENAARRRKNAENASTVYCSVRTYELCRRKIPRGVDTARTCGRLPMADGRPPFFVIREAGCRRGSAAADVAKHRCGTAAPGCGKQEHSGGPLCHMRSERPAKCFFAKRSQFAARHWAAQGYGGKSGIVPRPRRQCAGGAGRRRQADVLWPECPRRTLATGRMRASRTRKCLSN